MRKKHFKPFAEEVLNFTASKKNITDAARLFTKQESKFRIEKTANFGWRTMVMLLAVFVVFLAFLARAMFLQLAGGGKYRALSDANKTRNSVILAERGVVYDRNGEVLARNRPSFAVELNKSLCAEVCDKIISKINDFVILDSERVKMELASGRPSIILANDLDQDKAVLLEANLYQLPGVSVIVYPIRDYLYPEVFSHSVGYVGLDDKSLTPNIIGKTGVENAYNDFLSGIPGRRMSEVDSTGKRYNTVAHEDALPGRDATLYLDKDLSVEAYQLLKKVVEDKKATAGVVVAQDPSTGGVLALVSYPSFDANKMSIGISGEEYKSLSEDPAHPFFNRTISAAYPPGSTFKMVTASAALSENVVTRYTTIFDPGYIEVNGFRFNNWNPSGHGEVDMVRAIQVSNDTYFYTVGGGYGSVGGVGIEKLYVWARRFGLGTPTGIDIGGEVAGYMPDGKSREWYLGDTYITAIGQGDVLVTPLQLNVVTSYFANGGYLYKPRVVKLVSGVEAFIPEAISQNLISKSNYEIIREGLHKAVLPGGTGYPVFDFPIKHGVELGGKTGTSEFINRDGKPSTHAWFTVFGPFEPAGRATIALTVFLEGGGAGSDDAAPIARSLLDLWFGPK